MRLKYLPYKRIKKWREANTPSKCPIFGCRVNDAVVDHCHDSGFVRGVIHRQSNAWAGKIENAWKRYGLNNSKFTLPQALRGLADYLENARTNIMHPVGLKQKVNRFSRLPKEMQENILLKKNKKIDILKEYVNIN